MLSHSWVYILKLLMIVCANPLLRKISKYIRAKLCVLVRRVFQGKNLQKRFGCSGIFTTIIGKFLGWKKMMSHLKSQCLLKRKIFAFGNSLNCLMCRALRCVCCYCWGGTIPSFSFSVRFLLGLRLFILILLVLCCLFLLVFLCTHSDVVFTLYRLFVIFSILPHTISHGTS